MANIDVSHLTSAATVGGLGVDKKGVVTGSGVFDNLMEAVNVHLDAQYNSGRLTGAEYATVYLGALQGTIQQSIAFVLGEQQADKQADLIDKQIATEIKKTSDVASTTLVRDTQSANDTALKTAQTLMTNNQAATEVKKTLNVVADTLFKDQQTLLTANQVNTEANKTIDVASTTSVRNVQSTKDSLVKDATTAKITAERNVLAQKEITEYAQTQRTTLTTPTVDSIMGRQGELYNQQAQGFRWNADQKYLKTIMDAWAVNVASADGDGTSVVALNTGGTAADINGQIASAKPS